MGLSKPVKIITQEVVVTEAAVDLSEVNAKLDTISENVDTTKTYASNVNSRFTSARASAIDTINTNAANAATNAANAATNASNAATNSAKLTDARMGYIDVLSNLTANRIKLLDNISTINTNAARLTSTRAGYIDKLANGVGGAMGHKITNVTTTPTLAAGTSYDILSLTGAGEFYTIAIRNTNSNNSMTVWLDIYVDGVQLVPSEYKVLVNIGGSATEGFGMQPYDNINYGGLRLCEDVNSSDAIIPLKFKQSLVIKMYVHSTNNSTAKISANYALQ